MNCIYYSLCYVCIMRSLDGWVDGLDSGDCSCGLGMWEDY